MLLGCLVGTSICQGSVLYTATTTDPLFPVHWHLQLLCHDEIGHPASSQPLLTIMAFVIDHLQIRSFWQLAASCSSELRCQIASMVEAKPADNGSVNKPPEPLESFHPEKGRAYTQCRTSPSRPHRRVVHSSAKQARSSTRAGGPLNRVDISHLAK